MAANGAPLFHYSHQVRFVFLSFNLNARDGIVHSLYFALHLFSLFSRLHESYLNRFFFFLFFLFEVRLRTSALQCPPRSRICLCCWAEELIYVSFSHFK